MVRPSSFLICSVRVPELRHGLVIPVPLFVLADLLQAAFAIWALAVRLQPGLADRVDRLDRRLSGVSSLLPDVSRLFAELRRAGPFTLVDVDQPEGGVRVSIRLI